MPSQNENLRRRRLIQQDGGESRSVDNRSMRKKISDKQGVSPTKGGHSGLLFSFLCLVVTVAILIIFFGIYTDSLHPIVDTIFGQFGYSEKRFAVVIDAGSTGSRVLAFEFHKAYLDGRLVLDKELFRETKPGLSSQTPEKGAQQINDLLNEAKNFIPKDNWANTPLVLKATAGLRLLGTSQANAILEAIRSLFANSGFSVNKDSVEIMDGTDEGIFSWFTVNFLMGRLNSKNTVAALDLGGGSTQATYELKDYQPSYKKYIHTVPTFNSKVNVFTTSYLGLGLMALRHSVITYGGIENQTTFESSCMNPIIKDTIWNYGKVEFTISGMENKLASAENPEVDYEKCSESIKRQVLPLVNPKPITMNQHHINAFSYYYDRAIEVGLVDPFKGGEIVVAEFTKKSREVCATPNADQPWMCLDLIFISTLLEDGFGLKPQTKIRLYKQINGHEISWALGCAYNTLQKTMDESGL
ncbi:unnamed protein product [Diamesa serratosioi]